MSDVCRWETDSRYYTAFVQQNLFGSWEVVRVWGALHAGQGGVMCEPADSREDAMHRLALVARQRARRGYRLRSVNGQTELHVVLKEE